MGPDSRFDSTRGFPGEGPEGISSTPWFFTATTTRGLVDSKRRRVAGEAATIQSTIRRLDFRTVIRGSLAGNGIFVPCRADTALGRFLKARMERAVSPPDLAPIVKGDTPVPRVSSPLAPALSCARELRDFTHPLPSIPAGDSLRRTFTRHFGGLHGMETASFEEVWKAAKDAASMPCNPPKCRMNVRRKESPAGNGYNNASDAHFQRFHADFLQHNQASRFHPMGIRPGDGVLEAGARTRRRTPDT